MTAPLDPCPAIPHPDGGHFKLGFRKAEFMAGPVLYGRKKDILLANHERHCAVFAIVELDSLIASHNEKTFASSEGYPTNSRGENINDRNYSEDKTAQAKVMEMARSFDPEVQISTSAGPSGLPVITQDGIVVSGNNRTMSMKLLIEQHPERYEEYLKVLAKEIGYGGYGFSEWTGTSLFMRHSIPVAGSIFHEPMSVQFKTPVLIRIDYDFPEYTTTELSKYNKDTKKSERPIDKAIKLSSMLLDNSGCFSIISGIISEYDTFTDFYSNTNDVKKMEVAFLECNIITTNEIPQYIQAGTFTSQGKELLENLLAGMILDKEGLLASEIPGVKKLKQSIITSLPPLIANASLPKGILKADLNQAILIENEISSHSLSFTDYLAQGSLFETRNFSREAYILNRLLNKGRNTFKKAIESYNDGILANIGPDLFGEEPLSPQVIFDNFIKAVIDKADQADHLSEYHWSFNGAIQINVRYPY